MARPTAPTRGGRFGSALIESGASVFAPTCSATAKPLAQRQLRYPGRSRAPRAADRAARDHHLSPRRPLARLDVRASPPESAGQPRDADDAARSRGGEHPAHAGRGGRLRRDGGAVSALHERSPGSGRGGAGLRRALEWQGRVGVGGRAGAVGDCLSRAQGSPGDDRHAHRHDEAPFFAEAAPPTAILLGAETLVAPRATAKLLAQALSASIDVVPGAAHMLPLTHPSAVISAVLREVTS